MKGSIFLVRPGDTLVEMREEGYVTESVLQKYLADHPALLAGDQMSPDAPRKWLLVTQEMAVPDAAEGADRWSLDHLFLDQDAIPTLIETKRSTDTRIRREIVGQMLDYAANGVVYWPIDKLRSAFQRTCELQGTISEDSLAAFLGEDADQDEFWQRVEANLTAGRIRMVFVSDRIPQDLQRIVEFLNAQMDPAEVLAVEIKQFVGEGMTTLVPRVLGVMASTQPKSQAASGSRWDERRFVETMISGGHEECVPVLKAIMNWTRERGLKEAWGSGKTSGSFTPFRRWKRGKIICISVWPSAFAQVEFRYILSVPGFESEETRQLLQQRLNQIDGFDIGSDKLGGIPSVPLTALLRAESLKYFLDTLDWFYEEVAKGIANAEHEVEATS